MMVKVSGTESSRFPSNLTVSGVPNLGPAKVSAAEKEILQLEFTRTIAFRDGKSVAWPVVRAQYREALLAHCGGDLQVPACIGCASGRGKLVGLVLFTLILPVFNRFSCVVAAAHIEETGADRVFLEGGCSNCVLSGSACSFRGPGKFSMRAFLPVADSISITLLFARRLEASL